ncbi:phosphatidylinositol N-acetylglucosaminyltransferase subunit C [Phlyctochytrium arcticum]|nr:phosphatidylinositol N-acetylglucosaminyltransferase subunit C [Phlyctochytrium arcticum]
MKRATLTPQGEPEAEQSSIPTRRLGKPPAKWQKLLYIQQDYPDNYVDDSFLEEMKKNVNVRQHHYWTVVHRTTAVSQQISSVLIFVAVFVHLYTGMTSPRNLIGLSFGALAVGYVIWDFCTFRGRLKWHNRFRIFRSSFIILLVLVLLTPILTTLTKEISSDTVWALTVMMILANLVFHDYTSRDVIKVRFPDSLSINAGIFASVILASRLASYEHVFSLMLFAIVIFAISPVIRRVLRKINPKADLLLLLLLVIMTVAMYIPISLALVNLYFIALIFVNLVCPYWLIHAQKYKSEIRGPWDEARIGQLMNS